jgi:pSer/pThr/pTyr-binding forkhead associated (FHA) protein
VNADVEDTAIGAKRPRFATESPDLSDTIIPGSISRLAAVLDEDTQPVRPESVRTPARSYAFRIGRRDAVYLDAVTYVGRRPSTPRIFTGGIPQFVQVQSRMGEVSATHVELRQLGSTVVVTDMRSTNGTVVAVPGQTPRTLRQGESAVVTPGTLVDIGDNNVIEILPLQDLS